MKTGIVAPSMADRVLLLITPAACGIVALIGALVVIDWMIGGPGQGRDLSSFKPMAPLTAVCSILLGASILLRHGQGLRRNRYYRAMIIPVLAACLLIVLEAILYHIPRKPHVHFEHHILAAGGAGPGYVSGLMSPLTALILCVLCISMLTEGLRREQGRTPPTWSQLIASAVALTGMLFTIGYWYETPFLYDGTNLPPSLPTAVVLFLLGTALLFDGPKAYLSRLMSDESVHARIVRVITPWTVVIILAAGKILVWSTSQANRHDAVHVYVIAIVAGMATVLATVLMSRHVQEELSRSTEALRRSEHKYRTMINTSQEGIMSTDSSEIIAFVNTRFAAMLGYEPADMIGRPLADIIHEDEIRDYEIQRARRSRGEATLFERRYLRKDGGVIWAHVSASPLFDEDGRYVGAFGMITDITERKRTEEILRLSDRILDASPEHVAFVDREYIYRRVNRAYMEAHGLPEDRIVGAHVADLLGREVFEKTVQPMFARCVAGEEINYESWFNFSKKGRRYMAVQYLPQRNSSGDIVGVVVFSQDITGRKKTEERIEESERKYRTLFESSVDAVFILDPDGNFIDFNQAAYARLGYTREEMLAMHITRLDTPEFAEMVPERLARIREHGQAVFESAHVRKDGSIMPVEINSRLLEFEGRQVFFSVIRDITERKRATRELRESRERYRSMFENSPIAVWEEDFSAVKEHFDELHSAGVSDYRSYFDSHPDEVARLAGLVKVLDINNASVRLIGAANRDQVMRDLPSYFTAESLNVFKEEMIALAEGQTQFSGQIPILDVHENRRVLDLTLSVQPGYEQTLKRVLVSFLDITDSRRAAAEIRLTVERLRLALEAARAGTWEWDLRTNENIWSEELWSLYGIEPHSCTPSYEAWRRNIHPDDRELTERQVQDAANHGMDLNIAYRVIDSRGAERMLMSRGRPLRDAGGRIERYIGIVVDITERRNAEEVQRKLEEQLRQAQKMEAVGTLAGGVAHDFNNILTAITGYAHLIAMEECQSAQHGSYANEIIASTERASNLTQSLLAFSRKQSVDLRPVNINEIIFGFKKMLGRVIGEDIEFTVNLSVDDLFIEADRGQIEQVLMNLVANARDAMPKGGRLMIQTHAAEIGEDGHHADQFVRPGRYSVVSVTDSGTGMAPDVMQHIFEPFFTTKEVGKGTGLGLSMVYGIVKKHGGYITVSSDVKSGTTFRIYLPLISVAQQEEGTAERPSLLKGSETVLLIEDDIAVRGLMKRVLANSGYTLIEAANGDEAIDVFRQDPSRIDMVISDVIMPGKNGREVYDILHVIRNDIKVLFISGYQGDILNSVGVLEQRFHTLQKPVSPLHLLKKVREVLDGQPTG